MQVNQVLITAAWTFCVQRGRGGKNCQIIEMVHRKILVTLTGPGNAQVGSGIGTWYFEVPEKAL